MEKQCADKLILQYQKRIFGFALEKMRNIAQAEELASNIVCEVYNSFLKAEHIANVDGYVYRVARNVYAQYINSISNGKRFENINEVSLPFYENGFDTLENEETLLKLKQEIGYLSQRQRSIIYLHYYEKKSVKEIAQKLGISTGTVKWHLSDARSTLKEELVMERITDNLAINPITFIQMGHYGSPGEKGDTKDMFDTQLKQNIAFACYYEPLTIEEIARKISVPITYVADEINILCDYGYIDKMDNCSNPKYRTNMLITDGSLFDHTNKKLFKKAAKFMCDNFYTKVFADFDKADDNWGLSCDGNDKNFMKYNIVMLCTEFAYSNNDKKLAAYEKLSIKRPDGGCFIAYALVSDQYVSIKKDNYWTCGCMTRNWDTNASIQLDCRFSDRSELTWRDNLGTDWDSLRKFIASNCSPDSLTIEEYKRLCDKGYIFDDKVQVMTYKSNTNDDYCHINSLKEIICEKVHTPHEIKEYSKKFDRYMYESEKDKYPVHIQPIVEFYNTNHLSNGGFIPYLIEEMLERNMLKPLTDLQKKSVFSVMVYK